MSNLDDLLKNNENKSKKPNNQQMQGQKNVTNAILNIGKEQEAKEKELEAAKLAEQEAREKELAAKEAELAAKAAELEAAKEAEEARKKAEEAEEAKKKAELEAKEKADFVKPQNETSTKETVTKEQKPKKPKDPKVSMLFKMSAEMKDNLDVLAGNEERTLTGLLTMLCKNYINEEKNKQIILEHKENSLK